MASNRFLKFIGFTRVPVMATFCGKQHYIQLLVHAIITNPIYYDS